MKVDKIIVSEWAYWILVVAYAVLIPMNISLGNWHWTILLSIAWLILMMSRFCYRRTRYHIEKASSEFDKVRNQITRMNGSITGGRHATKHKL
jgi:hypothetical protein